MSDYTLQVDIRANASSANKEIKGVNNGLNSIKSSAKSVKSSLSGAFNTSILKGWKVSADKNVVSLERFDKGMKSLKSSSAQAATATKKVTDNIKQTSTATASTSTSVGDLQQAFGGLERVQWFSLLTDRIDRINEAFKRVGVTFLQVKDSVKKLVNATLGPLKGFFGKLKKAIIVDGFKNSVSGLATAFKVLGTEIKRAIAPYSLFIKIAAAVSLIKNAINVAALGDEIKDNAQKVGMTTTAYQEWGYVLKQNGVEMSSLKAPMRQLNKHITEGDGVLQKYGITATTTQEAFEQSISLIQRETDATKKLTMATEIFGARSAELLPVFNLTENETKNLMLLYRELGATQSDELVAAGDKLSDNILHMQTAWQGLKNTLAGIFMPALTAIVQWITIAIAYVNVLIKTIIRLKETFGGKSGAEKSSANIASNLSSGASAAKEMKRQLAGFDELNILSDTSTSGGGTSTGIDTEDYDSGSSSPMIPESVIVSIQNYRKALEDCNSTTSKFTAVAVMLFGIFLGLNAPVLALVLGITMLSSAMDDIANGEITGGTLIALAGGLGMITAALFGLGVPLLALLPALIAVVALIAGVKLLIDVWREYNETGVMTEDMMKKVNIAIGLITIAVTILLTLIFGIPGLVIGIIAGVVAFVLANKEKIEAKFKEFCDGIGEFFAKLGDAWREGCNNIKDWFSKHIGKFFTKEYWTTKWNNIKDGAKTGIKSVANTVIEKIETMVNNISKKFNDSGLIRGINEILGTEIKLPTISIPRLASGGIITTPTIAQLGEYSGARSNPEIAAPQSLLESIIQANNSDIISALYSLGDRVVNSVDNKDTNVYLDSTRVSREVTKQQKTLSNLNGSSLVNAF